MTRTQKQRGKTHAEGENKLTFMHAIEMIFQLDGLVEMLRTTGEMGEQEATQQRQTSAIQATNEQPSSRLILPNMK